MKRIGIVVLSLFFTQCVVFAQKKKEYIKELRVLSYNIHHANPPSQPNLIDVNAIADVILKSKADIVALQEVDRLAKRSGDIDQAKLIAEKTGMYYQFFKAIDLGTGEYGLAILSKFQFEDTHLDSLTMPIKAEQRILANATIKINNKKIIIANTHLDASKRQDNRVAQINQIIDRYKDEKLPIILCGDLNTQPSSKPINLLDQSFIRTCISNCLATFPQDNPKVIIDYIATKNFKNTLISYEVIAETYASDHRPIMAIFKMK